MAKLISVQDGFTSGELSFRIKGRTTNEKYREGLLVCENYDILPQGPVKRRNGSLFINSVKDPLNPPRLISFVVSVTQSFQLEFGDSYIRFFTNNAAVADSSNPTQPFELVTPYSIQEVFEFDVTQAEFSLIITHGDHEMRQLSFRASAPDDWTLSIFEPSPPPTFENGKQPNATLSFAQQSGLGRTYNTSSDVISESFIGRSIVGIGRPGIASIKTFVDFNTVTVDIIEDFEPSPYAPGEWKFDLSPIAVIKFNTPITRIGGIVQVGAVDVSFQKTFQPSDIGKYLLVHGGVLQLLTIVDNGETCECEILKSLTSSEETINWTMEEPTWTSARGFPSTVTQAQQRLVLAATRSQPQTIWFSETGILNGFGIGSEDTDSTEVDVVSNDISTINWIMAAKDIVIGTTGGESTIDISNTVLTPNPIITNRSSSKSDTQIPVVVGSEVLFIQKGNRKIISYFFDFNTDTYKGDDLTYFSEQITKSGIKQLVYAQDPNKQLFAVTNDGDLVCGTYDREQSVIGFSRYTTNGKYLGVQTIPNGEVDQVWVIVQRQIGLNQNVYIETFDTGTGEDSADIFSDSSLVFSNPISIISATNATQCTFSTNGSHGLIVGDRIKFKDFSQWQDIDLRKFTIFQTSNTTFRCNYDSSEQAPYQGGANTFLMTESISGLSHLEGMQVQVKVDNAAHTDMIVENGSIQLDSEYAEVVVGLENFPLLSTLAMEFDIGKGSMQGQTMRRVKPILRVENSITPTVNGDVNPNRIPAFNLDESVPLFSGDLEYPSGTWGQTAQMNISVKGPFPLILLGIFGTIEGNIK